MAIKTLRHSLGLPKQIECGLAWSVLLSTTIRVITAVKMLWTLRTGHIDPSKVVWTLIDNGKLANQIARLAAIVVKYTIDTISQHWLSSHQHH